MVYFNIQLMQATKLLSSGIIKRGHILDEKTYMQSVSLRRKRPAFFPTDEEITWIKVCFGIGGRDQTAHVFK